MERIALITGIGLVSPLGGSADETWDALLGGRCISDHARVSLPGPADRPRATRLALQAAREAMAHAGWNDHDTRADETALVIGTSKGSVEDWTTAGRVATCDGLADLASDVARDCGFGMGPRLTLSAACASGLHALIRAVMMIRGGEARRALIVAAEASVTPLFIGSFRRLGVLAPEGHGCRPFDERRAGFLMSEAASAVCLEASDDATIGRAVAGVDRFAIGNDSTHLTGSDPEARVLRRMLQEVLHHGPIDLVHAHGTGTTANDAVELAAIESTAQEGGGAQLYSHKGAIGHSLGASGLVSIALNCQSHRHG
ncbi:MAG: beta-ketoacyl synthase N-terminal-like domain-containing protein, partial [Vicinamibacterales bacterium]